MFRFCSIAKTRTAPLEGAAADEAGQRLSGTAATQMPRLPAQPPASEQRRAGRVQKHSARCVWRQRVEMSLPLAELSGGGLFISRVAAADDGEHIHQKNCQRAAGSNTRRRPPPYLLHRNPLSFPLIAAIALDLTREKFFYPDPPHFCSFEWMRFERCLPTHSLRSSPFTLPQMSSILSSANSCRSCRHCKGVVTSVKLESGETMCVREPLTWI